MITVSILINGQPIFTRSAVREGSEDDDFCNYLLDDGGIIKHDPRNGAVDLAKKMLDTIKEQPGRAEP